MNENSGKNQAPRDLGGSTGGPDRETSGPLLSQPNFTLPRGESQRPRRGAIGAVTQSGELFYIGCQHVAAVRDGWLERTINGDDELLHKHSVAFRIELLALARPQCPNGLRVTMPDGAILTATWAQWDAYAFPYNHKTYGEQEALGLTRWTTEAAPEPEAAPAVVQGAFAW